MLTILAMVLTLLPTAAYAQEMPGDNAVCACTVLCGEGGVNDECPVCGIDNADLSLCKGGDKPDPTGDGQGEECVCTVLCDGEHVNAACPVCAADNADLSLCVGTAKAPVDEQVQAVQSQIDALPTAAAVRAMTNAEQEEVYEALQAAYEAYEALSEEQKDKISGVEIFERLFAVLGGMIAPLEAQTGDFTITGNEGNTAYSYSDGVLTVKDGANITISGTTASAQIVVDANAKATITLNGVNITAPAYENHITSEDLAQSALILSAGANLTLKLAESSTNTLIGGAGVTSTGAPGIDVPSGGKLTIQGAGRLSVTGGGKWHWQCRPGHYCLLQCGADYPGHRHP